MKVPALFKAARPASKRTFQRGQAWIMCGHISSVTGTSAAPAAAGNAHGNAKAASFMKVGSVYPIEFETRCRRDLSPLYRGGYSSR